MLVPYLIDTRTKLSKMSRNIEGTEGILSSDIDDGHYIMNMKTFEGRNRLKTVTDVMQPSDRKVSQSAIFCINLFSFFICPSCVIPIKSVDGIYSYCYAFFLTRNNFLISLVWHACLAII